MSRAIVLSLLSASTLAHAQNYSIDWFTVSGGGGVSTGGVYSVSGTIGQPAPGLMTSGPYSILGGFWAVVAAVQNSDGPLLKVTQALATGAVTVSWPVEGSTGFILEETSSLNNNSGWTLVEPVNYQTSGTNRLITVPSPINGFRVYRLKKP